MAEIRLVIPENGARTLLAGSRHVHSTYNPEREAERQAEACRVKPDSLVFLFGPGLGYLLQPLLAVEKLKIVAVEHARFLTGTVAAADERVVLVNIDARLGALDVREYAPETYSHIQIIHGPAFPHDPCYASLEHELQQSIDAWSATAVTRRSFAEVWADNFAANIARWNGMHQWKAPEKGGATVVIAAAGPSLPDAREWVTKHTVPVWAVDTAWPVLMEWGVEPVLVANNDPQAETRMHFAKYPPETATLLTTMTANPVAQELFKKKLIYHDGYFFSDYFPQIGEKTPFFSHEGGSVAMVLYQAAIRCGATRVILLGQDLAAPLSQGYPVGTAYHREAVGAVGRFRSLEAVEFNRFRGPDSRVVEGVSGPVRETPPLANYRAWLERYIASHPEICWYNTATRGVAIAGSSQVMLSDIAVTPRGLMRVGDSATPTGVSPWLGSPCGEYVAADVAARDAGMSRIMEQLRTGRLDEIIARLPELPPPARLVELFGRWFAG